MSGLDELQIPRAYDIYAYADGVRGAWIGGAPDVISASILAASAFDAAQRMNPKTGIGVGVVETTTNVVVTYVGWETPEV